jgi:hypothetical protein
MNVFRWSGARNSCSKHETAGGKDYLHLSSPFDRLRRHRTMAQKSEVVISFRDS